MQLHNTPHRTNNTRASGLSTLRSGINGPFNCGDDLSSLDVQQFSIPETASLVMMAAGIAMWLRPKRSD
jgi:hypothetical protein